MITEVAGISSRAAMITAGYSQFLSFYKEVEWQCTALICDHFKYSLHISAVNSFNILQKQQQPIFTSSR